MVKDTKTAAAILRMNLYTIPIFAVISVLWAAQGIHIFFKDKSLAVQNDLFWQDCIVAAFGLALTCLQISKSRQAVSFLLAASQPPASPTE